MTDNNTINEYTLTEAPKEIGYYIDNVITKHGHSWDIAEAI